MVGRSLHETSSVDRPQQHAASSDPPFEHRRRAGVEPREHLGTHGGGHIAVSVDRNRGEVSAARRAERLEDRMPELERPDTGGIAARAIDGRANRGRKRVHLLWPARARTSRHEHASALLDVARKPPRERRADFDVVQHDDGAAPQIVIGERVGLAGHRFELRRVADRQTRVRYSAEAALPRSTTVMWTGSIGDTTKLKVLSVASASSDSRTLARVLRPLTVNASKTTDALLPGSTATGLVRDRQSADFERDGASAYGLLGPVRDARGHDEALLIGERRARERHAGHAQVRLVSGTLNRDRRQRRALGQLRALLAPPPSALEVTDDDDLALAAASIRPGCFPPPSRRARTAWTTDWARLNRPWPAGANAQTSNGAGCRLRIRTARPRRGPTP